VLPRSQAQTLERRLLSLSSAANAVRRSAAARGRAVEVHFYSEGGAAEFAPLVRAVLDNATGPLSVSLGDAARRKSSGGAAGQATQDDLDRMTQADVLVAGGERTASSFFAAAAHLCDRCIVVGDPHDSRFAYAGRRRPPHHQLVAGDASRDFDAAAFDRAWEALESAEPLACS
jgi:hypothetical protein